MYHILDIILALGIQRSRLSTFKYILEGSIKKTIMQYTKSMVIGTNCRTNLQEGTVSVSEELEISLDK